MEGSPLSALSGCEYCILSVQSGFFSGLGEGCAPLEPPTSALPKVLIQKSQGRAPSGNSGLQVWHKELVGGPGACLRAPQTSPQKASLVRRAAIPKLTLVTVQLTRVYPISRRWALLFKGTITIEKAWGHFQMLQC